MTSIEPLVSVIMPFFNGHSTVVESVKTVLSQTYSNFELVIVNDGSNQPTLEELLAPHLDSRIKIINHEKNKGLSATRNTAFEHALGELILPLDCDDMIAPSFLRETVELLSNNPEVSAVFTQVKIFGELDMIWVPEVSMLNLMCGLPIPSAVLFRREVFNLVGGFNTQIKCVPDVDFWLRYLSKGEKLLRLEKPLYIYRKHSGSLSDEGKLTEVSILAEANKELFVDNLIDVLRLQEKRYFDLKSEYGKLESGFQEMKNGYEDLLHRYDDVVSRLQKRSIKYHLRKIVPFL